MTSFRISGCKRNFSVRIAVFKQQTSLELSRKRKLLFNLFCDVILLSRMMHSHASTVRLYKYFSTKGTSSDKNLQEHIYFTNFMDNRTSYSSFLLIYIQALRHQLLLLHFMNDDVFVRMLLAACFLLLVDSLVRATVVAFHKDTVKYVYPGHEPPKVPTRPIRSESYPRS